MLIEQIKKIKSEDLLNLQSTAIALADNSFKIFWFNKSFQKDLGPGKLKGKSLKSLFNINTPEENILSNSSKSFVVPFPDKNKNIIITPLFNKDNKKDGMYFIEMLPMFDSGSQYSVDSEKLRRNIIFQDELQRLLVLLVKESSIDRVAEEILDRCKEISSGDFGLIAYYDNKEVKKILYNDNNSFISNREDVEKTIKSESAFINKWLENNKRPLLAINHYNNIGYGFTQVFNCESLCISPCYFDNVLHAKIFLGKKNGTFSSLDISAIEQFSVLLSFAISNIKTKELNATLESGLLQAQKLETIGKLSSGMAHDFNNLLSSIFGSIHLLRHRVPNAENIIRLLDNIENCSIRARDLTKGLLSFGKPTVKRKEIVMPNSLIGELIKVVKQTFPPNIIFEQNIEQGLRNIIGNSTEIYQILLNLCVNAKEAIEGKGKIIITAVNFSVDDSNYINYPFLEKGNYIKFSVSDTGTGIEEENISKIFDPYFSTKKKDTGSGLGLYVTYGILKAHNGYIDVTSKKGEGTTFDVYLPIFEFKQIEKIKASGKIIMLVNDEEKLADLLSEMLELNGYNVIKVKSGEEAITVLTEELKVDLLIIDHTLPGKSGLECITEIRKQNFNFPVILTASNLHVDNDEVLKKFNVNLMLPKPFEFESMIKAIKQFI